MREGICTVVLAEIPLFCPEQLAALELLTLCASIPHAGASKRTIDLSRESR